MTQPGRYSLASALFALGLFLVAGCPLAAPQNDTGSIVGQISIARSGHPPSRIKVALEARGAVVNEVWTDDEGRYSFLFLVPNLYHVKVNDERFQPYSEDVSVNPVFTRSNILNITLIPKPPEKPAVPQPQVAGQNPYVVDASYAKEFPKKVIKEFEAGVKEQDKGKLEKAIKHFEQALTLAPDFYPAHNNLGTAYVTQGRFDLAREQFESVLKLNQGDTQAYFNLGNVFLLTENFPEARRILEEGLRRQPQVALGHFLLGTVLARTHENDAAERELRKAQELDPLNPKVHLELVNLYLQQQKRQLAIAELHAFLTRFPDDPLAPQARAVLGRLEGSSAKQ
ncbi:MAG TPA: tetratricopeptide repeat protein [Terriglobales bacterium]|nr:tetratricopeptide repeat protein [Terriglobales bacterium]